MASSRQLPPDIIFYNILPRLPAKSLLRFKSVSKQWHSFLKTPLFDNLHLHHHRNNLKFLVFFTKTQHAAFTTIDCEALLDHDGLTASRSFPFEARSDTMAVLTSFRGLVCVGIINKRVGYCEYSDIILWNPLTGEYKTLSRPDSTYIYRSPKALGLYYSSCDDDYKLLSVTRDCDAYIYSLKSDSWRKLVDSTILDLKQHSTAYMYPGCLWPSITINEKLYFLKHRQDPTGGYRDSTGGLIIRFDTKTEKFTEIATPSLENHDQYGVFFSLVVLRGCIHFFVIYSTNADHEYYYKNSSLEWQHVECWLMDEDGNWIEEVTLPKASYIIIEPLHLMSNGRQRSGLFNDRRPWKLDLTGHIMTKISFTPGRSMYIPHRGKYIDTLVSPNRYVIDEVRQLPLN